jgi:Phosphoadenosine phosphosulfate reductase family
MMECTKDLVDNCGA